MKNLDRWIQKWRIQVAAKWINQGDRVLDIGCFKGEFFKYIEQKMSFGVGFDPLLEQEIRQEKYRIYSACFQEPLPFPEKSFDAIVMLATFEHISERDAVVRECYRLLKPGGKMILTVPDPMVDTILGFLTFFHLIDGMSLEQHTGFKTGTLPNFFAPAGFQLLKWRKFQLGMNNLFVFLRPPAS